MSAFSLFFGGVRFFKKKYFNFNLFYFLGYQNRMGMDGSFVFLFSPLDLTTFYSNL